MTTTSDNTAYIDYTAFGIGDKNLTSLRALSDIWRRAITTSAGECPEGKALQDFVAATAELPAQLAHPRWQQSWLHAWYRLHGQGFMLTDIFRLLHRAISLVEAELFDDRPQAGRIELALFRALRASILAAASGALELGEQIAGEGSRFSGEFAAIHMARAMLRKGERGALLSVALENSQRFANLTVSDLQALPALIADRLQRPLRPQDHLYRGRDGEWLLLLPGVAAMSQPALAAAQIEQLFADPLQLLSGRSVRVEPRIGIAMFPSGDAAAVEPVGAARIARMNLQPGGEPFTFFDPLVEREWQHRHRLAESLLQALRHDGLQLYLQPQVDGGDGRCIGAELLLRWHDDENGWVSPQLFVKLLEENGWRAQFTDWLLRTTMRTATELSENGIDCRLSINLVAGDLLDTDLPEQMAQNLQAWRQPGSRFTFELTESAMMADPRRGAVVMHRLRNLGINMALDDFGTGYSSLSYLATLPINEIKIDRSFVVAMSDSAEKLRIVRTIVDLTHDLGMISLAEGIENEAQRDQLLALGCRRVQGFFFGKPMTLAEFIPWYRARQSLN